MLKSKQNIIKLKNLVPPALSSREIISDLLLDKILEVKVEKISLDFTRIEFISRSAAHETRT